MKTAVERVTVMFEIVFSVVLSVFLPVVMISCGYWFVTNPPDNINGIVGYRSKRSMINGSTWAYAHKVSGIHWLICGAIGLLCPIALAVLGFTGTISGNDCFYGLLAAEVFQQILLLSVMPVTEHKLKNKFNDDGTLR